MKLNFFVFAVYAATAAAFHPFLFIQRLLLSLEKCCPVADSGFHNDRSSVGIASSSNPCRSEKIFNCFSCAVKKNTFSEFFSSKIYNNLLILVKIVQQAEAPANFTRFLILQNNSDNYLGFLFYCWKHTFNLRFIEGNFFSNWNIYFYFLKYSRPLFTARSQ